jgi:hypothetical protein
VSKHNGWPGLAERCQKALDDSTQAKSELAAGALGMLVGTCAVLLVLYYACQAAVEWYRFVWGKDAQQATCQGAAEHAPRNEEQTVRVNLVDDRVNGPVRDARANANGAVNQQLTNSAANQQHTNLPVANGAVIGAAPPDGEAGKKHGNSKGSPVPLYADAAGEPIPHVSDTLVVLNPQEEVEAKRLYQCGPCRQQEREAGIPAATKKDNKRGVCGGENFARDLCGHYRKDHPGILQYKKRDSRGCWLWHPCRNARPELGESLYTREFVIPRCVPRTQLPPIAEADKHAHRCGKCDFSHHDPRKLDSHKKTCGTAAYEALDSACSDCRHRLCGTEKATRTHNKAYHEDSLIFVQDGRVLCVEAATKPEELPEDYRCIQADNIPKAVYGRLNKLFYGKTRPPAPKGTTRVYAINAQSVHAKLSTICAQARENHCDVVAAQESWYTGQVEPPPEGWTMAGRVDKKVPGSAGRGGGVVFFVYTPADQSGNVSYEEVPGNVRLGGDAQASALKITNRHNLHTFELDNFYTSPSIPDADCVPDFRTDGPRVICWDLNGHDLLWDARGKPDARGAMIKEKLVRGSVATGGANATGAFECANDPLKPTRPGSGSNSGTTQLLTKKGSDGRKTSNGTSPDITLFSGVKVDNWGLGKPVGSDHVPNIFDVSPEQQLLSQLVALAGAGSSGNAGAEERNGGHNAGGGSGTGGAASSSSSGGSGNGGEVTGSNLLGGGGKKKFQTATTSSASLMIWNWKKARTDQYKQQLEQFLSKNPQPEPGGHFCKRLTAGEGEGRVFILPSADTCKPRKTRLARKKEKAAREKSKACWWRHRVLLAICAWLWSFIAGKCCERPKSTTEDAAQAEWVNAILAVEPDAQIFAAKGDWGDACNAHAARCTRHLETAMRAGAANGAVPLGRATTSPRRIFHRRKKQLCDEVKALVVAKQLFRGGKNETAQISSTLRRIAERESRKRWEEKAADIDWARTGTPGAFEVVQEMHREAMGENAKPDQVQGDHIIVADDGELLVTDEQKANGFAKHLASTPKSSQGDLVCVGPLLVSRTPEEVTWQGLQTTRSAACPGPDKCAGPALRAASPQFVSDLSALADFAFAHGSCTDGWLRATICLARKSGKSKFRFEGWRPLTVTSLLVKAIEKCAATKLGALVDLDVRQCAYEEGRAAPDHVVALQGKVQQVLREGKLVNSVNKPSVAGFCVDFTNAFEEVDLEALDDALTAHADARGLCPDELLALRRWVRNFTRRRTFRVKAGETLSDVQIRGTGVPQGTILGPILWNILLDVGLKRLSCKHPGIRFLAYADDLFVYVEEQGRGVAESELQAALGELEEWAQSVGLRISAKKTQWVVFGADPFDLTLRLKNGSVLEGMEEGHKFLGVAIDKKDFSGEEHARQVLKKLKQRTNVLLKMSKAAWGASGDQLKRLYHGWVEAPLRYGATALASATPATMRKIEHAQADAARIIKGFRFCDSADKAVLWDTQILPARLLVRIECARTGLRALAKEDPEDPLAKTFRNCGRAEWVKVAREELESAGVSEVAVTAKLPLPPDMHKARRRANFCIAKFGTAVADAQATKIYVDGASKDGRTAGAAVCTGKAGEECTIRVHGCSYVGDAFVGEQVAVLAGTELALEKVEQHGPTRFDIFSDNESVLLSIGSHKVRDGREWHIKRNIVELAEKGCATRLIYLPKKAGTNGGSTAHKTAVTARDLCNLDSGAPWLQETAMRTVKTGIKNRWADEVARNEQNSSSISSLSSHSGGRLEGAPNRIRFTGEYTRASEVVCDRIRHGLEDCPMDRGTWNLCIEHSPSGLLKWLDQWAGSEISTPPPPKWADNKRKNTDEPSGGEVGTTEGAPTGKGTRTSTRARRT